MTIKGVIFDLDGVIVSTDELHYNAWKYMADIEGIYFDKTINHRLRGVSRMASLEIILERSKKVYTKSEKIRLATIKNDYYVESLKTITPNDLLPGVLELLTILKDKNIKTAIGSSSKNAKLILKQIGLEQSFGAVADGNDISKSKPDPEVFLIAAEKLHLKPNECMVIEDAVAGIIAANRANMTSVAINDATKSNDANFKINNLLDIAKLIE